MKIKISQIVPVNESDYNCNDYNFRKTLQLVIVIVIITISAKVICNCNDYILNVIITSVVCDDVLCVVLCVVSVVTVLDATQYDRKESLERPQ